METLRFIALVFGGFSIVSALILAFVYLFFLPQMSKSTLSKAACCSVLVGLALLQLLHIAYLYADIDVLSTRLYTTLLIFMPFSFYTFSRFVLFPKENTSRWLLLHLLPVCLSPFLEISLIPSLAFTLGSVYTMWLASRLYHLRKERVRFHFEMFFFGLFALMAIIALALGLALPTMDKDIFFTAYSLSISSAMILVVTALLAFPELLEDVIAVAERAYTKTKLEGVNSEEKISRLERLMKEDRLYENEDLSLASVAELLELSAHQLSELINTRFNQNFPRFIREYRINAAKSILIQEPEATILAIGMQTGFKSQSAFYNAFKNTTGLSPGAFRKQKN